MTDDLLEQRLRAWHRDGDVQAAPQELRDRVFAIVDVARPQRTRWTGRNFTLLAAAALLTVVLIGGAVLGAGWLRLNAMLTSSPTPNATALTPSEAPPTA